MGEGYRAPDRSQKNINNVFSKAILQVAQMMRLCVGAIFDIHVLPKGSDLITSVRMHTQWYAAETRRIGKGHGLGPPYIHAFGAFLTTLGNCDIGASRKKFLHEFDESITDLDIGEMSLTIKSFHIAKTFDSTQVKLFMFFRHSTP